MGRNVEEIFNGMVAEKQTLADLSALMPNYNLTPPGADNPFVLFLANVDSGSTASMWRYWLYVVAQAEADQELLWDDFQANVQALIDSQRAAVKEWYRRQALIYQDGYQLTWIDNKWQYLANDPTAQIIKQCSVVELANGYLRIKVAADDGSGNLIPLTSAQLSRFSAYMAKVKYAGTNVNCFSFVADTVNSLFNFTYDALLDLTTLQLAAKTAVINYLKSLQFDGAVVLNGIIDALQAVPGIVDAVPVQFEGKYGLLPYSSFLAQGDYQTNAGYAILDETIFNTANWQPQ